MSVFKQQFSVFKQHFTFFNTLFHPHVFLQKFLNNNFQFLNTCTKRALSVREENPFERGEKVEEKSEKKLRRKKGWFLGQ